MKRLWSAEEDEKLRELYPTTPKEVILSEINRSWYSIVGRAKKLNLWRRRLSFPDLPTLSEGDAKWLACAIDTDGCIGLIRKRKGIVSPYIEFANDSKQIVEKFGEMIGSKPFISKRQAGKKQGWRVREKSLLKVKQIIESVLPYLIVKKERAIFVLNFIKMKLNTPPEIEKALSQQMFKKFKERFGKK